MLIDLEGDSGSTCLGLGSGLRVRVDAQPQPQALGLRRQASAGSVLVATPGSVHSTCIELQLLIIPQHAQAQA